MHYKVIVIIEKPDPDAPFLPAVESAVEHKLRRFGDGAEWDWYQIGGRYTGGFDGYDPDADARNMEKCWLCGGTGDRASWRGEPKANQHPTGCNGCAGKGFAVTWPTQWPTRPEDVMPVAQMTDEQLKTFAVVVSGDWFGRERYEPWREYGEAFQAQSMPTLEWLKREYGDHLAVIVDCHN